ncbi:MAG TPA: RNA polymerase sigma factor [Polyangiaceae bacterium]|nr:RNA polymerase sigma factor [Polyangiaceae bacterium]
MDSERPPESPALNEEGLLAALRDGDPKAASAFYDRAQLVVRRTVARLLGRYDSDVEDASQLALIAIVDSIDRFRGECPLDAWLSVVAARVVYRLIRRRTLERKLFSEAPLQALSVASSNTRRDLALRDSLRRLETVLEKVDANRLWAFLLHDAYGFDLREVASITGVSTAAAQTRLTRGRREVQERIERDPELANAFDEWSKGEGEA